MNTAQINQNYYQMPMPMPNSNTVPAPNYGQMPNPNFGQAVLPNYQQMPFQNTVPPPSYEQVSNPNEKIDNKNQEKEIKEVIEIINEAIVHLDNALNKISSATDWGLYDTLCGGDCISSMVKQDKMTDANREMRLANNCITKLKKEIKDVENVESLEISDLLTFMDVFFDNIFSDIMVQQKIAKAEKDCKKARRQLDSLRKKLKERLEPKTISEMQSEKKIKMDQEENIKAAFNSCNASIEILQKSVRPIQKASKYVGDEAGLFLFGSLSYHVSESKLSDAKLKLRQTVRALEDLSKKLKFVSIDTSNRSEYLKFIEESKDIIECQNTSFDRNAGETFRKLRASCLKSISEIESIRNELKDIIVKSDIKV